MATTTPSSPGISSNSTPLRSITPGNPSILATSNNKSTRGTNKPKCHNCGNVARSSSRCVNKPKCHNCGKVPRSRCPFQACKSCCAKAQNPCIIHDKSLAVVKDSSSVQDKLPSSSSSVVDQQTSETPSSGNSFRPSYKQLSQAFSQFNNLQPARARKPLTIREASQINEWRFSKLKEYKDRNVEIENEAFDRYLQNVTLLEEVFAVNSKIDEPSKDDLEGKTEMLIVNMKMKLRADPVRTENLRDRTRFIVNNGLRKLKSETATRNEEPELVNRPKKARLSSLAELNKKLTNARTDEDLKSCQLLKAQLFNRLESKGEQSDNIETPDQQDGNPEQKSETSPPKWLRTVSIHQEALSHIDAQFSSLEAIEYL